MDRRSRRQIPRPEGLEDRQMLSTAGIAPVTSNGANPYGTAPVGVQVDGSSPLQQTIEAKEKHITNLPFFVGLLNRNGVVPQPTVENIQNDLRSFVAGLHPGVTYDTATFNHDVRRALSYQNIRPQDNAALNRDFGAVLVNAGVQPQVAADLQAQMNQLVDYASQPGTTRSGSAITATNDYATVLQLALGSGRPLVYPNTPGLLGSDHNGNVGKTAVTHSAQPSLTGNYVAGTNIQIVDANNQTVLGTGAVSSNGVYRVKFAAPLPDGTYTVRVRADDSGFLSEPSPKFTFIVKGTTPRVNLTSSTPAGPLQSR